MNKTLMERLFDVISLLLLIMTFVYIFIKWSSLPSDIPMGFDSSGGISHWGDRKSILGLPLFGMLAWVIFSLVEKFPHNINLQIYKNEDRDKERKINRIMVNLIKNAIVLCLVFANWRLIEAAL